MTDSPLLNEEDTEWVKSHPLYLEKQVRVPAVIDTLETLLGTLQERRDNLRYAASNPRIKSSQKTAGQLSEVYSTIHMYQELIKDVYKEQLGIDIEDGIVIRDDEAV